MAESVQPELDARTIRAITEYMTVVEKAQALFEVTTQSGSAYTVDLVEPACTCPDFQYRDTIEECKHIRRVRLEVGQVDADAFEADLASQADELETEAGALEEKAQELAEHAAELEAAIERLNEVVR